jgi:hypothetical protein
VLDSFLPESVSSELKTLMMLAAELYMDACFVFNIVESELRYVSISCIKLIEMRYCTCRVHYLRIKNNPAAFEVFTAVVMKSSIFWAISE